MDTDSKVQLPPETKGSTIPSATSPIKYFASAMLFPGFKDELHFKQSEIPTEFKTTMVTNKNGNKIEVAWHEAKDSPKGIIIACHPKIKYGMSYLFKDDFHSIFSKHGYHTVFFNFRGYGKSTYRFEDFYDFADDIHAISLWAQEKYQGLPLILYGLSLGGYWACIAAWRSPQLYSMVIFDSAFIKYSNAIRVNGFLLYATYLPTEKLLHYVNSGLKPLNDGPLQGISAPLLALYGDKDVMVSREDIIALHKANSNMKIILYQDCPHLEARKKYRDEYLTEILTFIKENLNEHEPQANYSSLIKAKL
jgi:pimeloyl-ACP methyl ester carboxylesterase